MDVEERRIVLSLFGTLQVTVFEPVTPPGEFVREQLLRDTPNKLERHAFVVSNEADDFADDSGIFLTHFDRVVGGVAWHEADALGIAVQSLHGCVVSQKGGNEVAVVCRDLGLNDHQVTGHDSFARHRIAFYSQQKRAFDVSNHFAWDSDQVFNMLLGVDRSTGSDTAEKRKHRNSVRRLIGRMDYFDRPRRI